MQPLMCIGAIHSGDRKVHLVDIDSAHYHGWAWLDFERGRFDASLVRCRNCHRPITDHTGRKCLWDSTVFEPRKNAQRETVFGPKTTAELLAFAENVVSPYAMRAVAIVAGVRTVASVHET